MHRSCPAIVLLAIATSPRAQDTPPGPAVVQLVETGRAQALAHDWDQAIATLSRALAAAPDDVEALRWRGHAYTGAKRYAEGLADLERALELGAEDAWTHYARAMALHHLGQHERAVRGYTDALAIDPAFYKAYEWRGYTRSLLGDHVAAIADLDRAIAQDGANAWLFFIRGKAWASLLDFDHAELDLWKTVDADDHNADAHAQLGYLKTVRGDRDAAVAHLQRAVALDARGQVEARLWLHHLLRERGEDAAAQTQLDAVREAAAPENDTAAPSPAPELQWPLRQSQLLRGELTLDQLLAHASEGVTDAHEVDSRRCAALLHAGLVAARARQREQAQVLLARAIATDATDQWEWSLARARLRQLGDEGPR